MNQIFITVYFGVVTLFTVDACRVPKKYSSAAILFSKNI